MFYVAEPVFDDNVAHRDISARGPNVWVVVPLIIDAVVTGRFAARAADHGMVNSAGAGLDHVIAAETTTAPVLMAGGDAGASCHGGLQRAFYLIVGAGFAGSVLAERLASQAGKRMLIVDKRNHIGGNAYTTMTWVSSYTSTGRIPHQLGRRVCLSLAVHRVAPLSAPRARRR